MSGEADVLTAHNDMPPHALWRVIMESDRLTFAPKGEMTEEYVEADSSLEAVAAEDAAAREQEERMREHREQLRRDLLARNPEAAAAIAAAAAAAARGGEEEEVDE